MRSVCIIGLGYVGLPLAELSLANGFEVYGLETDENKVRSLQISHPNIKINAPSALKADVVIIAVPTPLNDVDKPDFSFVEAACKNVAEHLDNTGRLVVLESTVNPFVSRKIVLPILEQTGLQVGKDFYLAHCPERIDPGNTDWNVSNISRVIGAISQEGLEKGVSFYKKIVKGDIMPLSSVESAEMVKVYENSLRAVNIAFANEMAIVMQNLGLDTKEIINGVKSKPFGLGLCYPGPGVGGHCIGVDPFYLINESKKRGFDPSFLQKAMKVNSFMPSYVVSLLINGLNQVGKCVRQTSVGILGVSYKKGVPDMRQSPSLEVLSKIEKMGGIVKVFDPYATKYNNATLNEVMECDAVLLLTNHEPFLSLDYSYIPVIVDTRNVLDRQKINGIYVGMGR
jgi:UDP-N-acetyl-D-glucosamine dehydrogenase